MVEKLSLENSINRRNLLRLSGYSLGGMLVGGSVLTLAESLAGKVAEPLNQKVEELLLKPQALVPEFPISAIEPKALIVNTYDFTPKISLNEFRLVVDGEVNHPLSLDMAALQTLPKKSMVIRHVCVEGWAAIVQWGGVPLRELIQLAQPKPGVKYAYFISADRYYESWDLASCLHPQTMLAYEKNGEPLPIDHGAPLRLASPIKLGYKLSKWVIQVTLVSNLLPHRGFWEDQSYEWFAGL
ncbi:molybdopterin-dependent oxidoreductase [Leptolyngbyaceae cyanobacterium UHCC 1019]